VATLLRRVPGVQSASATRLPPTAVVVRESGKAANDSLCKAVAREGFGARVVRVVPR
jgi:hypothetical protein